MLRAGRYNPSRARCAPPVYVSASVTGWALPPGGWTQRIRRPESKSLLAVAVRHTVALSAQCSCAPGSSLPSTDVCWSVLSLSKLSFLFSFAHEIALSA